MRYQATVTLIVDAPSEHDADAEIRGIMSENNTEDAVIVDWGYTHMDGCYQRPWLALLPLSRDVACKEKRK